MNVATLERFMSKVETNDHWHWQGCLDSGGYGNFWLDGRAQLAHRVAYEMLVGPIPEGLTIDHLCRVRSCVNPAHMEPTTMRENILRGISPSAQHARKTRCPHGHAYTEENTKLHHGKRVCRTCERAYERGLYHRRRGR